MIPAIVGALIRALPPIISALVKGAVQILFVELPRLIATYVKMLVTGFGTGIAKFFDAFF